MEARGRRRSWRLTGAAAWLGLGLLAMVAPLAAYQAQEVPQVHALHGVRIVVAPGRVVESGTVVFRDGVIVAAGGEVQPPADARLWDRKGLTVYPGLIDAYTVRSWPGEGPRKEGERSSTSPPSPGGHPNDLVRPERDMALYGAEEGTVRRLREAGFTTAVVAPQEGLFRGTSILINLGEGSLRENLLLRPVAQNVTLRSHPFGGGYPSSLMGAVALFRQTLMDAHWYARAQDAHRRKPSQERPEFNTAYEALGPVVNRNLAVVFETEEPLETLRAASLAREFRLQALVAGNGKEYQRLAEIGATGLPHLLPLAFPEAPDAEEGDLDVELEDLRHWDRAPENPKRLLETGLPVAFTSHRLTDPKEIHGKIARALTRGLNPEDALAALTTTPARLLGIADRAGTVEPGKMANLVVVEGDLFVDKPKIREVWIDGRRYEVKESKPPEVDPAGTWDLQVTTGEGAEIRVLVTLTGEPTALKGSIQAMDQEVPLSLVEVSGKTVGMEFDGTSFGVPGTITMNLEIEGDQARGSGTAPDGTFTVRGRRIEKPSNPKVAE